MTASLETALDEGRSLDTVDRLRDKLEQAIAEVRAAVAERWRGAAA